MIPELYKIYEQFDTYLQNYYNEVNKRKLDVPETPYGYEFTDKLTEFMIRLSCWMGSHILEESWTFEKSTLKGNLLFDNKEDYQTWIGKGKIDYGINAISKGVLMGSNAGGSILGSGTTILCSEESWFSVYPESGTYELFLVPGDGEKSGITVELFSYNEVWQDVSKQINKQIGEVSDKVLKEELREVVEANYKPEKDDLFYCSDPDKWIVDVEGAKLPEKGLIIKGETPIREGHTISWTIEPANY